MSVFLLTAPQNKVKLHFGGLIDLVRNIELKELNISINPDTDLFLY
jgi:hypothetical protein